MSDANKTPKGSQIYIRETDRERLDRLSDRDNRSVALFITALLDQVEPRLLALADRETRTIADQLSVLIDEAYERRGLDSEANERAESASVPPTGAA